MRLAGLLPLRTERLVLREVRDDDVDAILGYCGDDEVTRYLPFDTLDRAGVLGRVERWRADLARDPADDPGRDWGLTLVAEHEGVVVGDVMLRLKAGEVHSVAELGYVFAPAVGGRGLAVRVPPRVRPARPPQHLLGPAVRAARDDPGSPPAPGLVGQGRVGRHGRLRAAARGVARRVSSR
jgi:hypothetical protein